MWVWFTFSPGRGASRSTWVAEKDAGQQKVGESWSRAAKESPNLNIECLTQLLHKSYRVRSPECSILADAIALWLISSRGLAKRVSGNFSVSKWNTWDFGQEVYCDISDFTPECLCGLIWAAKLGVSTVIQWQGRSIGCITGKKKNTAWKSTSLEIPLIETPTTGSRKNQV